MSNYEVRKILYFEKLGPRNTGGVIDVTKQRIEEGGIKNIAVGEYSSKSAMEATLMATDCSMLPLSTNVLSIVGPREGADTAIVPKSTFSSWAFSEDSN